MAADSIVGAGLAPSPYAEVRAENERLRRDLAAAREALRKLANEASAYMHAVDQGWDCPTNRAVLNMRINAALELLPSVIALAAAPAEPKEEQ